MTKAMMNFDKILVGNPSRYQGIGDLGINQNGLNTVISFNHNMDRGTITLENFNSANLDASDFIFS
jgi:hypothetical protein